MLFIKSTIEAIGLPVVGLVIVVVMRVAIHRLDVSRIFTAARRKGWKDVVVKWDPFAPGFLFENGERHYVVTFRDRSMQSRTRRCKTGLLTGVFWAD